MFIKESEGVENDKYNSGRNGLCWFGKRGFISAT